MSYKKIAIMQPYLFPYIGYYQLINMVDKFIVFDVVQYIKHGWMNRNRILSPELKTGWQYFGLPIKNTGRETFIKDIKINPEENWFEKILGKLSYYKKIKAPYYYEVIDVISKFHDNKHSNLVNVNIESIKAVFNYLEIEFEYEICSEKDYDFSNVINAGDWAFEISKFERAAEYINPIGGVSLFDKEKFLNNHLNIKFLKSKDIIYRQSKRDFIPSLSIIDVMMFNSKERIKEMLNEYELL